jgi:ribosomal peptide maturation radical SAM protein 1
MPDTFAAYPALGLGILHTILSNAGLAVKTLYPSLWFRELLGIERLKIIRCTETPNLAVEWIFSRAAFRADAPLRDVFIEKLLKRNPLLKRCDRSEVFEAFRTLSVEAVRFIDSTAERILEHQPRIVGCGSMFQQHVASLALLRRIRELAPEVVTLMGGANCETVMGKTTHRVFPWVDYVVSGEADVLIAPLCAAILDQGREISAAELPAGVFGPVHRQAGYPVASGADGVPRASLNSLAGAQLPNYDDYFEQLKNTSFGARVLPAISFESSRGCWWGEKSHCTFCGLNGPQMRYRVKEAPIAVNQIEELYRRYGTPNFFAVDNIIDMHYFDSMLPSLAQRGLPLRLFYETKANLKRRHVKQLFSAGVLWIQPGIESLNTHVLTLMAKGVSAAQNIQLLRHTRQVGLNVQWQSILGFPGELGEWYAESAALIPLITHLQPGGIVWLRIQRFSPYHTRAEHYGLDLLPSDMYAEVYPLAAADIADIAYYFQPRDAFDAEGNIARAPIPDTPGHNAYVKGILMWNSLWAKNLAPVLQYEDIDEVLHIEDTRPVAPARFTTAEGLARDVMLLLEEEGSSRKQIAKRLESEKGAGAAAVNEIIDSLIRRKLMLEIDGRVINLALAAPLPAVPASWARQTELHEKAPEPAAAPTTAAARTTAAAPA